MIKRIKKRHNDALRHTALVRWMAGEAICTSEGEHDREPVVFPGGAEGELPMPEVVGEEADLDKDEGEVNSMQELEPGIVEDEQQGQAHRQKAEGEGQPARVVSGLLLISAQTSKARSPAVL